MKNSLGKNYNSIVKAGAWYDLLTSAPFAFPILANFTMQNITQLHNDLNLSGTIPTFEPLHFFFMNLMGSIIVVWSILRIRHTQALLGLYDAFGRTLFSAWMAYYLFAQNQTMILFFLLIPEISWGIIQYYGYWQWQKQIKK